MPGPQHSRYCSLIFRQLGEGFIPPVQVAYAPSNGKLSNSVRCFALWHFYTLLNHTCNICNGIGAVILEPF